MERPYLPDLTLEVLQRPRAPQFDRNANPQIDKRFRVKFRHSRPET